MSELKVYICMFVCMYVLGNQGLVLNLITRRETIEIQTLNQREGETQC